MSDLGGVGPTTGATHDYYFEPGCTGFYRDDPDWGEHLVHAEPCPVHNPNNCPLCGSRDGWCTDKAACNARVAEQIVRFVAGPDGDPVRVSYPATTAVTFELREGVAVLASRPAGSA